MPESNNTLINVFDFFNPFLGRAILIMYLKLLAIFPQAYGRLYGWGNDSKMALYGRDIISRYLAGKMKRYIDEYRPTLIVCTHATPAGLVAYLLRENKINIPVVAVITDFIAHRLWIYPELSYYCVANRQIVDYLIDNGISATQSLVTGIPVAEAFTLPTDRLKVLRELQLNPAAQTVLIMGGGAGILPMDEIVAACDTVETLLQLIIVTGSNETMYRKLVTIQPNLRHTVRIVKYIANVHELMAVSDLLITKPGGMTSAEALSRGLPMLIYHPIPGQEEANTRYLVEQGVALRANSAVEVAAALTQLLITQPGNLVLLRSKALAVSQPMAATDIAKFILSRVYP
jgi:processive 1,2-diacylglycerol beta-glucosyltransferase